MNIETKYPPCRPEGAIRSRPLVRLVFCLVVFPALLSGSNIEAGTASPLAHRKDAIIVKGHQLPSPVQSGALGKYRLFSFSGSTPIAIPFQIDEFDHEGNRLLKKGPQARKGDGLFSDNDELVFMARDSGASRGPGPPSGCEKAAMISLADSERGTTGYVMLALCENPPALSSEDYVNMDIGTRTVSTRSYSFGWRIAPVYYYDYLTIGESPDLLDRIKVRCSIGKWDMTYTFTEEDFHTSFIGYTDGPVRVTWKSDNYWSLGPFGKIPSPQSIDFYPDYIVDHNDLDMNVNPAVLGLDFVLLIGHDLSLQDAESAKICANIIPQCIDMSAKMPEEVGKEIKWGGFSGPDGAMITRLVKDPRLTAPVKYVFDYDPGRVDQYEYIKGSSPMIGFEFNDWRKVPPEVYDLVLYHFFMDQYSDKELSEFNRIVDSPVTAVIE